VTTAQADLVTIGKIERPFGVKGAVKVRSLSDVPGRFDRLGDVSVMEATGRTVDRTVTHVRRAGPTYIVQFAGITTPEDAGTLRGGLIQVPRCEPSTRAGNALYECDLIGLAVVDEEGHDLGLVDRIWELPGHQLFVVQKDGRELLIPAAKNFVVTVDLAQRRMMVRGIEGLVEDRDAL
jgi:16S rRNA processing protein RimM